VTSFLDGRRRFKGFLFDFSIRETKDECFTNRLSLLEFMNESVTWAESGRSALRGAYGSGSLDLAASLARRDRRLEGTVGAYMVVKLSAHVAWAHCGVVILPLCMQRVVLVSETLAQAIQMNHFVFISVDFFLKKEKIESLVKLNLEICKSLVGKSLWGRIFITNN
jgi:hypothetical protein